MPKSKPKLCELCGLPACAGRLDGRTLCEYHFSQKLREIAHHRHVQARAKFVRAILMEFTD